MTKPIINDHLRSIADALDPSGATTHRELNNEYLRRIDESIGTMAGAIDPETGKVDATKLDGMVPASSLPSYVDDVIEAYIVGPTPYASDWLSLTPSGSALTPEVGKIYVVLTQGDYENCSLRWGGTEYAVIGGGVGYTLPAATADSLGGIKVGDNLSIAGDGTLSATDTTYSAATPSTGGVGGTDGLMSAADKEKLVGIESGAQANQNAFAVVRVGSTDIAADSATDAVAIVAGDNVTITPDAAGDSVTIAADCGVDLGITGAEVGQVAQVASVDSVGKPTAWGASRVTDSMLDPNGIMAELAAIRDLLRGSTISASSWAELAAMAADGSASNDYLVGIQVTDTLHDTHASTAVDYDMPMDISAFETGVLDDQSTLPVMILQSHWCLPFSTQFSPYQAFLYAIDGLPAGTYNVTFGFNWGSKDVISGKTYQFTLANDLPAGGQLSGFEGAPDQVASNWRVKAWADRYANAPTETVTVSEGSDGTSLGTFTVAGAQVVPASGMPTTYSTVNIGGTDYTYYGLNSLHRVAYGNNRWLHSALRQWLNATGTGWFVSQTVFDRVPSYASYPGFLSMLPEELVAVMQPIRQVTALSYATDGGTSSAPEYDVTYDKVFLPSWEQHFLQVDSSYGGTAGLEGTYWPYWKRVAGVSEPWAAGTTHTEFITRDMTSSHTARNCWMRSANRGSGVYVTYVTSSGGCTNRYAINGYYAAPACAIGLID